MNLAGKVALVTGGSRGIGAAIALELAKNGAEVAFTYLAEEEDDSRATLAQLGEFKGRAEKYILDISDFAAVQALVAQVVQDLGGLDILINNAGMNWDGVVWKIRYGQLVW